jgi:hypothetical protein
VVFQKKILGKQPSFNPIAGYKQPMQAVAAVDGLIALGEPSAAL